jgi:hypothetical protein
VTGLDTVGLVDELGDFNFIRADGVQFVGTALTAVNDVVADLEGITAFGHTFPDASTHGTGTFSGESRSANRLAVSLISSPLPVPARMY